MEKSVRLEQARIASGSTGDYRLLLDRLAKAQFDEAGREFVRRALAGNTLLDTVDDQALLRLAVIARQHGLIDRAREIYERLHARFPSCEAGWHDHIELLQLLDDRPAMVRIQARAGQQGIRVVDEPDGRPGRAGDPDTDILAPFEQLRREDKQIRLFMRIFRGREDAFARQWVNRDEGSQGYVPVRRPLRAGDIRDHLAGRRTLGIYLLDRESRVHLGVIDVDLVTGLRDAAEAKKKRSVIRRETLYLHKRIITLAQKAGLCCLAEVSGGKGYHFWFPVREPVEAAAMRAALKGLISGLESDVECFSLEVFPKQDRRTGKGFGNLVKLPLGIHRGTGKPSTFVLAADRSRDAQFDLLADLRPAPVETVLELAGRQRQAPVIVHPRHAAWAEEFPELARLEQCCAMLGQLIATVRSGRNLTLREEKILLSTIGHLPRAGLLLHHLFSSLPEYSRPLLDYKISRVRGTPLGCKRIHSLMERSGDLECVFEGEGYPHPLRHLGDMAAEPEQKSERVENLKDALVCLKTAIRQVERFMGG